MPRNRRPIESLEIRCLLSLPVGGEYVFQPGTTEIESEPSVAIDAQGNYVVAWRFSSDSDSGIYAQRFDPAGNALNAPFKVNGDGHYGGIPSVAMNASGQFVVTWGNSYFYGDGDIFARQFNADGTPFGASFQVNVGTTDVQAEATVAINDSGDFVICWVNAPEMSHGKNILVRQFDSSGAPLASEFIVSNNTAFSNESPSVGMDNDGDFVVAWQRGDESAARRYNAAGVAQGSEFRVAATTALPCHWGHVAMDAAGNFVIASWRDDSALVAQRYNASGNTVGSEFRVDQGNANYYFATPGVDFDSDGDFVVSWTDRVDAGGYPHNHYDLYARRYDASGNPLGNQFKVNAINTPYGIVPTLGLAPDNTVVALWRRNGYNGEMDVRIRKLSPAPSAAKLTVNGTSGDDRITLTFQETGLELAINGQSTYYDPSSYSRIEVLCGDGNDVVKIHGEVGIYVLGGLGNDSLTGGDGNDTLSGAAGNDWILGGIGDDLLSGGKHSDKISGTWGNDTIRGDQGSDSLNGNEGTDCILGGVGNDTLHGSWDNDSIFGEDGADRIYGENGYDSIDAGAGDDRVRGGEYDDWITGGADNDIIYGNEGNDTLYGGDGDDRLMCGADNNTVYGEGGNDYILGGTDFCADLFHGGIGRDSIEAADGYDVIQLIEFSIQNG